MKSLRLLFELRSRQCAPRTAADLTIAALQWKIRRHAVDGLVLARRRPAWVLRGSVEDYPGEELRMFGHERHRACALGGISRPCDRSSICRRESVIRIAQTSVRQVVSPAHAGNLHEVGSAPFGLTESADEPLDHGRLEVSEGGDRFCHERLQVHRYKWALDRHHRAFDLNFGRSSPLLVSRVDRRQEA